MQNGSSPEQDWSEALRNFVSETSFLSGGGVITDLDGTAVHEYQGRVIIAEPIADALKTLNGRGHPILINTMRFPLNVIETFGVGWSAIANAPLPIVSLNGSLTGHLEKTPSGMTFYEYEAFPLYSEEIGLIVQAIAKLHEDGFSNLILFYYPRDWQQGEIIWSPDPDRLDHLREKYKSASQCFSSNLGHLHRRLQATEICMIFLLVEEPQDRLMAYQHAFPMNFVTRSSVDKSHGLKKLCARLNIDVAASVGAGDTPMDNFLSDVGLAVHVGSIPLAFTGKVETVKVRNSMELGALLFDLSRLGPE